MGERGWLKMAALDHDGRLGIFSCMTMQAEILASEALRLSPAERAELADKLIESLDNEPLSDEWAAEIDRRVREIEGGAVTCRPVEQLLAELRGKLG